ncbi:helix-turn-helix domain-containing protein [Niabella aquatica]
MIKIRQILRLHTQGYSKLKIAAQTGISRNTLKKYLKKFNSSGLSFEEIGELSDKDLEDLFVKQEDEPVNKKLQALFSRFPLLKKS